MSANRRTTGNEPGLDCPEEITFERFLERCVSDPVCRVQGCQSDSTKQLGRLVRFNRVVKVLVDTATTGRLPKVEAIRLERNRLLNCYVPTGEKMTLTWQELDWVSPQINDNPNGTWIKVKEVR